MRNINDKDDISNTNQTDAPSWLAHLKRSKKTGPYASPHNINLIMENDPFFQGIYWFNDMTRTPEVYRCGKFRDIKDADIMEASIYISDIYMNNVKPESVKNAILFQCEKRIRHPLKDNYLETLKWDKNERLSTWMHYYLGAEQNEYTNVVGCMAIIAMVARVYEPGCKYDYVVVLEGEQGIGKSTALRTLGGEYYSDSLPPIGSKDASAHVSRWWLIEISEFHTLTKAEDAEQKHFLSKQEEAYRPVYAKFEVVHKRQSTIWATINLDAYLRDETGNRRFWPVKCKPVINDKLDIDGLKRDRDQLFAEAVHRFKEGWHWYPTREFEEKYMKKEQESRLMLDPWQPLIVANLHGSILLPDRQAVNTAQIFQTVLGMGSTKLPTPQEAIRIGRILRALKCPSRRGMHGMLYDVTGIKRDT